MAKQTVSFNELADVLYQQYKLCQTDESREGIEAVTLRLDENFFKDGKIEKRGDFCGMVDLH